MILVVGATGLIGRAIVAALSKEGVEFRCAVRNRDKADRTLRRGLDLAIANLDNPARLETAADGCTTMILASSDGPDMVAQQTGAIDAVARAGVTRVIKISCLIGDRQDHQTVEAHLASSGLDWTVLRPCYLMQNLLAPAGYVRAESRLPLPFDGNVPIAMIDAVDIGAATVKVLSEDGHNGRSYDLMGAPETLNHFGTLLYGALDRTVVYVHVDAEKHRQTQQRRNIPDWQIDRELDIAVAANAGKLNFTSNDFEQLLGEPPRSLQKFLSYNVITFED